MYGMIPFVLSENVILRSKINQFSFEGFKFLSAILDGEIDMYVGGVNNIYNEKNRI